MRAYLWCNFLNEERDLTPQSLFHEVGDREQLWLLKMACFLLHTITHILSIIYNSANNPDQNTCKQLAKLHWLISEVLRRWMEMAKNNYLRKCWHWKFTRLCILYVCKEPLSLHVLGVILTVYCYMNGKDLLWRGSPKWKRTRGQTSTLPHVTRLDVGTNFTVTQHHV